MTIDCPTPAQIPALRRLWQQAFEDSDAFLDGFFSTGFAPQRCRCLTEQGKLAAALYWFDTMYQGSRFAYLYAVATDLRFRSRGFCHKLMSDTHAHLAGLGYAGTLLLPASASLRDFYAAMGYSAFSTIREFPCSAAEPTLTLRQISHEEYAHLRRQYLPENGVMQEGTMLAFLQTYAAFYEGVDCLFTTIRDGETLFVPELLGDAATAPGILQTLGFSCGSFRTPGGDKPFAMCRSLTGAQIPSGYFGLALD